MIEVIVATATCAAAFGIAAASVFIIATLNK